jgi:hypothetical protein
VSALPSRRRLAAVALLAIPAIVLTTPGVAEAAPTTDRADAAAGWLARQLDDDSHVVVGAFGPDYGLTADTVLALSAAKDGRVAAGRATKALKRNVLAYTGFGDTSEYYAGAFAKLLNVAVARRTDPRTFGGSSRHNLVRQLRKLECGSDFRSDCAARDNGRFADKSQFGDFSNAFGQSLAILGLERATRRGVSTDAVRFLRRQQCDNGAFPQDFGTSACSGSVDGTGMAVQALVAVGTRKALAAARDGARWLARRQNPNGSLEADGVRNTNSTALAAQAFDAVGRERRAREARGFLRRLQVGCEGDRADRGKVEFSRSGAGDATRATAQAVPALAGVTLDQVDRSGSSRGRSRLAC